MAKNSNLVVRKDASIIKQPPTAEQLLMQVRHDGYNQRIWDEARFEASFEGVKGCNLGRKAGKLLQDHQGSMVVNAKQHLQRVRNTKGNR